MTHRRDVSLSILAVALGVVVGTGTLTYIQPALDARVTPSSATKLNTRRVIQLNVPLRNENPEDNSFPTIKKNTSSSAPAQVVKDTSSCNAVRVAIEKVKVTYNAVIPNNVKNTEMRQKMDFAFADAITQACSLEMLSSSAAAHSAAPARKVDNNCTKFVSGTDSYLTCVRYQDLGVEF